MRQNQDQRTNVHQRTIPQSAWTLEMCGLRGWCGRQTFPPSRRYVTHGPLDTLITVYVDQVSTPVEASMSKHSAVTTFEFDSLARPLWSAGKSITRMHSDSMESL